MKCDSFCTTTHIYRIIMALLFLKDKNNNDNILKKKKSVISKETKIRDERGGSEWQNKGPKEKFWVRGWKKNLEKIKWKLEAEVLISGGTYRVAICTKGYKTVRRGSHIVNNIPQFLWLCTFTRTSIFIEFALSDSSKTIP